jgi:uncharacterized membrane protein
MGWNSDGIGARSPIRPGDVESAMGVILADRTPPCIPPAARPAVLNSRPETDGGRPMLGLLEQTSGNYYRVLLVLHIVSVVVGIGAVMLNGLYAAQTQKREGPAARAVLEANFYVSGIAEYVIYTIPVWGILLVLASDDAFDFAQTWIWLSLLLYAIAIGIAHAVMRPGSKRIIDLMAEIEQGPPPVGGPPPQVEEISAIGQRLAFGGTTLNVIVVIIISLMVWKPGL